MEPKELYGLPLERFTEERNALVKELRKEGRREEATEVSNLRKPSVAAWAVNQLVRTQRRDVANLLEAGDSLREAQSQLLAGHGDADALRDAVEAPGSESWTASVAVGARRRIVTAATNAASRSAVPIHQAKW